MISQKLKTTYSMSLVMLLLSYGCGQSPSFENKEAPVVKLPPGDPASADARQGGSPGSVDDYSKASSSGGTDDTANDHEPSRDNGSNGRGGDGTDSGSNLPPMPARVVTTSLTFNASDTADATVSQDLASSYLTSDLILRKNYVSKSDRVQQVIRPRLSESFQQGHLGVQVSESFNQAADRPLDIVVVIDNSGSMAEEQRNMASRLQPLLSYVNGTNWQIGVVTTDPSDGSLRKLIKKGDVNASQAFAQAVTAGTNHSNNERGILQAVRSISGYNLGSPWVRSNSTVAVLIVSDEDNCSTGSVDGDCPGKDYAKGEYLFDYLSSIRTPGKNAKVYGIIWGPNQTQEECSSAYNQANEYADVIAKTNGIYGSICDGDYSNTLQEISRNIAVVLNSKFTLKEIPTANSLVVKLNGSELPQNRYTLTGKVLEVTPPPADGSVISVSYRHNPVPMVQSVKLQNVPVVPTIQVKINGNDLPKADYAFDETANIIKFAALPPESSIIQVSYTRNQPLTSRFSIADAIKSGSLKVFVDDQETQAFHVEGREVVFDSVPTDGQIIDFSYQADLGPVLSYPFAIGNSSDLKAFDAITGEEIAVTLAGKQVVIKLKDFYENRVLTVRYANEARQQFEISLPQAPIFSTIEVLGGQKICKGAPYLVLVDLTIKVDGCGFAADVTHVVVNYKFEVQNHQEFEFASENFPLEDDYQVWTVWVNDRARTDYVRVGRKFSFPSPLPAGSVVKIQLIQAEK